MLSHIPTDIMFENIDLSTTVLQFWVSCFIIIVKWCPKK